MYTLHQGHKRRNNCDYQLLCRRGGEVKMSRMFVRHSRTFRRKKEESKRKMPSVCSKNSEKQRGVHEVKCVYQVVVQPNFKTLSGEDGDDKYKQTLCE